MKSNVNVRLCSSSSQMVAIHGMHRPEAPPSTKLEMSYSLSPNNDLVNTVLVKKCFFLIEVYSKTNHPMFKSKDAIESTAKQLAQ